MNARGIVGALALGLALIATACGGGGSAAGGGGSSSSGGGSSSSSSSGSSSSGGSSSSSGSSGGALTLPTPHARFDYQISEPYAPAADVAIVDRDWSASPVSGKYNICYVNAFQTQPEDFDFWTKSHPDLVLKKDGAWVVDEEWNELVLDVSSAAKRTAIMAIVGPWIDQCASKGFDAVEPDNLNSWERSQGLLTMADDVELAKLLAARAHARGLAIAQKNTSEMVSYRSAIGFDFAIVEECQPYGDCQPFDDTYGHRWFEIEYTDEGTDGGIRNFTAACNARGASVSVILRDRQVVPPTDAAYVYEVCGDLGH